MTEQGTPKSREELLSVIEREWNALMDVLSRLDETQLTTPDAGGWSPKDNLAHLTEWMKIQMGYHMDHRPAHEVMDMPSEVVAAWDFDVINRLLFERNRDRSVEDVLSEAKLVYTRMLDRLTATPFEELLKPRFPERPDSPTLLGYVIGNTYEHFAEHRETIEKGIRG